MRKKIIIGMIMVVAAGVVGAFVWRFALSVPPQPPADNSAVAEPSANKEDSWGRLVAALSGFPNAKTYLVLFQNNAELRPTGGFIGSFAVVNIERGAITSLQTADSYALDKQVPLDSRPEAPWQLKRWNATPWWYFRDANWDPDFPSSAKTIAQFFTEEQNAGGVRYADHLDGIITITPEVIARLLGVVGSITVDGKTFTQENFYERLQYYVERDYALQGVPVSERKNIIGSLAEILLQRLVNIPYALRAGDVLITSLKDRSILLWFSDPALQEIAHVRQWDGALLETNGDYVMLVEANLASLKTDPYVERAITYHVAESDLGLLARVDIDYSHKGVFTFTTTRLRSYARLYVPAGSRLIRVEGAMQNDRSAAAGEAEQGEAHGKTYFGAFVSIEPGDTHRLTFVYQLPDRILDQCAAGAYTFVAQKQSGTMAYPLAVDAFFKKPVHQTVSTMRVKEQIGKNHVVWEGALEEDQSVLAGF